MHKKMKLVLNYVRRGGSFIDIGCGTGEFIVQLRDRFNTLVGIDTSSHAIEFTARRVGKDKNILLVCGELDSLHLNKNSSNGNPRKNLSDYSCLQ
jgi:ubiquinone/menaquinone biosynthesis C-methylase UbiE